MTSADILHLPGSSLLAGQRRLGIHHILADALLRPVYQPIVDLQTGEIIGHEGLIRGPAGSPLEQPLALFQAAEACGLLLELERLARRVTITRFAELPLTGKLFLNVSPDCLLEPEFKPGETLVLLQQLGLSPARITIEITESRPQTNPTLLRQALSHYRSMGYETALDDLGEGFSSLRRWSELQPQWVKLDKHFVQGIHLDPLKQQFVRTIRQLADSVQAKVIAEGIEDPAELQQVLALGITLGQGYLFGKPDCTPSPKLSKDTLELLGNCQRQGPRRRHTPIAGHLLCVQPPLSADTCIEVAYNRFTEQPELMAIAVIDEWQRPIGLLRRHELLECLARPFNHELYGRRPVTYMMDSNPIIAEETLTLTSLSLRVASAEPRQLIDGFILTREGIYIGMGTGHGLMKAITEQQLTAARHANPLTQLPGNVSLHERIDDLLGMGQHFVAAYVDMDAFKAFNDIYGYHHGDEAILRIARLLGENLNPEKDFLGHIGGDDFLILFQSEDWQGRCLSTLSRVTDSLQSLYRPEHRAANGYDTLNRQGVVTRQPLITLSIAVVPSWPYRFRSHLELSEALTEGKKQAKAIQGNSLFIDRRRPALSA